MSAPWPDTGKESRQGYGFGPSIDLKSVSSEHENLTSPGPDDPWERVTPDQCFGRLVEAGEILCQCKRPEGQQHVCGYQVTPSDIAAQWKEAQSLKRVRVYTEHDGYDQDGAYYYAIDVDAASAADAAHRERLQQENEELKKENDDLRTRVATLSPVALHGDLPQPADGQPDR